MASNTENTTTKYASSSVGDSATNAPLLLHIISSAKIAQPPATAPPPPPPPISVSAAQRAAPVSAVLSVREKVALLMDRVANSSISEPSTAMAYDTGHTLVQKGLTSIAETIGVWEGRTRLTISYGFIGDASGGKPVQPGRVKMLAIARVRQQDLEAAEPVKIGQKFTVHHPLADITEEMPVIGTIKEGAVELLVPEEEAKEYFTSVGRLEDVCFYDSVGDEGVKAREAEKKAKKTAKKARQKEKKVDDGAEGGKAVKQDL